MTAIIEWSIVCKIVGSLIAIAASGLGGFYAASLDSFRIHDLSEMKKALAILKSEIEFSAAPLPEALKNVSARTERPISTIFSCMGDKLAAHRRETVAELWVEAVDACKPHSYLHNEDIEPIYAFGKTLGYLDRKMQISAITLLSEGIDEKVGTLSANAAKNKRMYRSLGLLGGLLAVVIFI